MEEPFIQVNQFKIYLPHHQGFELMPISEDNQATSIGGVVLTDRSYTKFGITLNYDMMPVEKYNELQNIIDVAYRNNSPIFFRYEKISQYRLLKKVVVTISKVDFKAGRGRENYYIGVTIRIIDAIPR